MTGRRAVAIGAIVLILLLLPEAGAAQCAMCRGALNSPEGRQMLAAFRSGILLLLVAPFAVFGTVAALVLRDQRRRDTFRGGGSEDPPRPKPDVEAGL
jgi:hypothetical protein